MIDNVHATGELTATLITSRLHRRYNCFSGIIRHGGINYTVLANGDAIIPPNYGAEQMRADLRALQRLIDFCKSELM